MFALHGFGLINIILYGAQGQLMHCWFQAYLNPLSSPLSNQLTQSLHQSCFQENLYATYLRYFANITSLVDSLLSCTVVHRHDEISTTHSLCGYESHLCMVSLHNGIVSLIETYAVYLVISNCMMV